MGYKLEKFKRGVKYKVETFKEKITEAAKATADLFTKPIKDIKQAKELKEKNETLARESEEAKREYQESRKECKNTYEEEAEFINQNKDRITTFLFPQLDSILSYIEKSCIVPTEFAEEVAVLKDRISTSHEMTPEELKQSLKPHSFHDIIQRLKIGNKTQIKIMTYSSEIKIKEENISKYRAYQSKLNAMKEAVKDASECIGKLTNVFEQLLLRSDSVIKEMKMKSIMITGKENKIKLELQPPVYQYEIMALITMGVIMTRIVENPITGDDGFKIKKSDEIIGYSVEIKGNIANYNYSFGKKINLEVA